MSQVDPNEPIVFKSGLSDEDRKSYNDRIAKARPGGVNSLKGSSPVGGERAKIPLLQAQPDPRAADMDSALPTSVQARPPGSPVLSPATERRLAGMKEAREKQEQQEAAVAAKKEDGTDEKKGIEKEDLFEQLFNAYGRNEAELVLNNKDRRLAIEARCKPMDARDLIEKDEVEQEVIIKQSIFWARFRSLREHEYQFIQQYLFELSEKEVKEGKARKSETVMNGMYSLCVLAASLLSINGKDLPNYLDGKGEPSKDQFSLKLRMLVRKSSYVIADLGLNYQWFDIRVRKLLGDDDLGNG